MEKTYDLITTCKASWIVNKIIWWDSTINNCWYYYRLKLNDWTRDYVIRWLEKNDIWYWTWCENNFYTFTWWQLPKVWDEMYVIAQYNDSWIIEQWKDVFNKFNYLSECPITAGWSPSYDEYLWADKCKVSWTIENINRTFTDTCWFNLWIKVKNWDNTYIIWWREYFSWKWISLCLWTWEWWLPIDISNWKITTQIKSWDNFYAILNQKDNTILRYWQEPYNNADSSIPICSSVATNQIQTFTWWLTENQIIQVMDTVEEQIAKDLPDLNSKTSITKTWTSNITSWNVTNTNENTEVKTSNSNQTSKVFAQISKIKQNSSISKSKTENTILTDVNSWTTIVDNNSTNTWLVQWTELQTKNNSVEQNNYYSIIWGVLVILLIWITLISIYNKKRKS